MIALRAAHDCAASNVELFASSFLVLGIFFAIVGVAALIAVKRAGHRTVEPVDWADNHPDAWTPPAGWRR